MSEKERPEFGCDTCDGVLVSNTRADYARNIRVLKRRRSKVLVTNSNYFVANVKVAFGEHEFAFRTRFYRNSDTGLVVYQRLRGELNE